MSTHDRYRRRSASPRRRNDSRNDSHPSSRSRDYHSSRDSSRTNAIHPGSARTSPVKREDRHEVPVDPIETKHRESRHHRSEVNHCSEVKVEPKVDDPEEEADDIDGLPIQEGPPSSSQAASSQEARPRPFPAQQQPLWSTTAVDVLLAAAAPTAPKPRVVEEVTPAIRHDLDHSHTFIGMRALIATHDAALLQGDPLKELSDLSGANIHLSPVILTNAECILDVSGPLDAVSLVRCLLFRYVVELTSRRPTVSSFASSVTNRTTSHRISTVTLYRCGSSLLGLLCILPWTCSLHSFVLPDSRFAPIIGRGGQRLRDVQEASGASLTASHTCLAGTTERLLTIVGVGDALHLAVFHIGSTLLIHVDRLNAEAVFGRTSSPAPTMPTTIPAQSPQRHAPIPTHSPATPAYLFNILPPEKRHGGETIVQEVEVPDTLLGLLVGKQGRSVQALRQQSSCQIHMIDSGQRSDGGGNAVCRFRGLRVTLSMSRTDCHDHWQACSSTVCCDFAARKGRNGASAAPLHDANFATTIHRSIASTMG